VGLRTLILHWDGSRWAKVPSPNVGSSNNSLSAVAALPAAGAWAAGYRDTATGVEKGLLLRWDGTSWTKVTCPNPATRDTNLTGVSINSATGAWASGYYQHIPPHRGPFHTLILHWNGTAWAQVPSPTPPTKFGGILLGISNVSAPDAWAAGSYSSTSDPSLNLLLHWDGTAWTRL
jgi:hypothetical protein